MASPAFKVETGTFGFPFTFTGEMVDANDLVYLRARYYHPGLGVFAGLDPVEGMTQQPMSLNGYVWVEGNTPNKVDPSGLSSSCQTQVTCPSALSYIPPVDYSTRRYVDDSYVQRTWLSDLANLMENSFSEGNNITLGMLSAAIARADAVGNDDAARHLSHWMGNSGSTLEVDVERMLRELPRWREDIVKHILNPSVNDLLLKVEPSELTPGCKLWTNRTGGGQNLSSAVWDSSIGNWNPDTVTWDTWRRVGQPGGERHAVEIYSDGGINTHPFEEGSAFSAFYSDIPSGSSYTREEFDWFIAMNAFDYSISESIIIDGQGNGQLCYQIHIADEHGW